MTTMVEQVRAFCDQYTLLPNGSTIMVAVSGGPDSLCLLHLLQQIASQRQLWLHVAHLDHQLRPDSADDAKFVEQIAAEWQIPVSVAGADVATIAGARRQGIEETARELRSSFLLETALRIGATAIALGHTADDQAETVLLRLLRGAGPSGLAAMRPKRPTNQPDIAVIRPLLESTRAEVEAYCREQQLTPRHDSSNESPIFTRNRVRGYIIPLLKTYNPSIVATLGRTARVCAEEDELLSALTAQSWTELAQVDNNSVSFDRQRWSALHPALQRRLIRKAAEITGAKAELGAKHIDAILAAIAAQRRRVQLPGGCWFTIEQARLTFSCGTSTVASQQSAESLTAGGADGA
jgi:tRNA(Ile)-lysidine synthase